ncbi:hypothetical protein [Mycolicibacterium parafortuitum]|uniref:Uncharacterized protein n=1 Tax=Mycolicibacterium parafortuitum TaxID=39692 RepID=A0A375YRG3_MYCPF|nr:hypothetical protein [Mycolicibacterium parafortuitum]ORB29500.1 hypothetical protein BST38_14790 [Mycolicibacterium parafortuitum]SRX83681.1 hypothetical protein MPP7335_05462 [Mycolicibacterium parafortuitum]
MSGWLEYVTTPEFWAGGVLLGSLGSIGTYFTTRAADNRRFSHEHDVLNRKEFREDLTEEQKRQREDKLREHENLYAVASEYTQVCTEILQNSIDTKGIFNTIRDMFYNRTGVADPNVEEKLDHAAKVTEENKRIMTPFNKMRLVAPVNVLDAASELNMAMLAVLRTTTEPFATPVTLKAAGDQLNKFINVFRTEIGKEAYTESQAQERALSFMGSLKKQVDAYMEEAKDEMRAAGFTDSPWGAL